MYQIQLFDRNYSFNYFISTYFLHAGIFANGHLKYDHERDTGPNGMPSLMNMTENAIQILNRNKHGFLLIVEGGMIDQAHHRGHAKRALSEVAAMDDAIKRTLAIMK